MSVKIFPTAIVLAAVLAGSSCTTVKSSSARASQALAGVGERVEYHAATVSRKTRSLWQRIFGPDEQEHAASSQARPSPTPSANELPNYPQQHVGRQN
jgi:hypothetical protein